MDRNQKKAQIEFLQGVFGDSAVVLVAHNTGLNVAQMTELRSKVRASGAGFKVANKENFVSGMLCTDIEFGQ